MSMMKTVACVSTLTTVFELGRFCKTLIAMPPERLEQLHFTGQSALPRHSHGGTIAVTDGGYRDNERGRALQTVIRKEAR